MKKVQLGKSPLMVTPLGLGCMSLGTDKRKAQAIIETALEEGINYFDTADLYDFGLNEQLVGEALKRVREDVIIATKVGNRWTEGKEGWRWDPSKAYIKEAVKQSLKRLSVEYIDLYQLHGGTLEDNILETIDAFEELKQEGFIKAYGISSIRPNVIREYVKHASIDSVMMQYSLLDRRPEEEVLPLLAENNISVVTRGPLAKGLLSENWIDKLSEQGYLDYSETELRALLTELKAKFTETRHVQEAAIQYNLAHKGVTSIIAGASSMEQVKENVAAVRAEPLSKLELTFMEQLAKMNKYEAHR
ncbi:aldo/keto reductase [Cytobacillus kochii]|uniref:aldo/keto reductase n=1 Tax=Cytobacillus kochii TaxID=859143 RepID=UPI0020411038|nr:aldo/keto reductase [Cytobacillus kochii]MCM3320695.1 aldo/keto reductase [Cytobacillus kochii]MCM3344471.1 aldo/keto reductase [Cytobacillus kochii]